MPGGDHRVFKAGIDEIRLIGAVRETRHALLAQGLARQVFHRAQHVRERCFLEALFHPPESHVRQVLEPFEIADRHTAGVEEHVSQHHHAALVQNPVGLERRGAVRALRHNPCLNARCVDGRDLSFERGRHENLAREFERAE